ncbi:hypothetical protein HYC85_023786 [Camellia sinensis]|uniref:Myb-like domain-containing protein n=1 Tax=Camellia sinensis TaxID=4442 RepID=A0A7J7GGA6_CAMSI|nr:hypothetical protein HYC85_023786 [Camellia sinensis]
MAAESNTGFRHGGTFGSPFSRHAISFQSGAINSTSDMIPMANYYGINSTAGMVFSGNSSIINNNPGMTQAGSSSGSFLLDSVPGLKHDADMAAEWSVEEQQRLEEGLDKYAAEPSIMKYIKIAAMLNDKDVRAVALRCRWMTRKKRKCDDPNLGKKVKDRKHYVAQQDIFWSKIIEFLLDDNIDLFFRARNNIAVILKDMREMPGIMRRMPPLPETLNEELANSILPSTSQQKSLFKGKTTNPTNRQYPLLKSNDSLFFLNQSKTLRPLKNRDHIYVGIDVQLIKWGPLETGAPMLMACSILEVEFDLSLYV